MLCVPIIIQKEKKTNQVVQNGGFGVPIVKGLQFKVLQFGTFADPKFWKLVIVVVHSFAHYQFVHFLEA